MGLSVRLSVGNEDGSNEPIRVEEGITLGLPEGADKTLGIGKWLRVVGA